MSVRALLVWGLLLLGGCAAGVPFEQGKASIPPIPADKARFYVYRLGNPLTLMVPMTFTLDGQPVSTAYSGSSFYYDVAPGQHSVTFSGKPGRLDINMPAHSVVYLRYGISGEASQNPGSSVELGITAEMVPQAEALRDLAGTTLVQPGLLDLSPKTK